MGPKNGVCLLTPLRGKNQNKTLNLLNPPPSKASQNIPHRNSSSNHSKIKGPTFPAEIALPRLLSHSF
ncbi:hypothetical protein Mpet_2028 [Methanolacinia petrolearia DSM 11571]|uniref:Uncharacterized protein n=1 Tax=Methanolacinia petrolearia (strain DSM 11571 / OCM 486 / SEBR 4847) TaxID=679926 RepID=E1RJH0_METP4|nr:hypothetical protein Mpet_2028 [Methanolacinia petrolearia DSM 11571]